ncbi:MAG: hypothetical protein ACKO3W_05880 [bacterium]
MSPDRSGPHRFFFVHVMKTGGTSLAFHLTRPFSERERWPAEPDRASPLDVEPYTSLTALRDIDPARRAEVRLFAGHLPLCARELMGPDVVTLTVLREPVARTVSVLKHFRRLWPRFANASLDEIYEEPFIFRHFVENFQARVLALTGADGTRSFCSRASYRSLRDALAAAEPLPEPAVDATVTIDAGRTAAACAALEGIDALGLTDDLVGFVAELQRRFGWWPDGIDATGRVNVSAEDWDVSPSLIRRIAVDNAADVEVYRHAATLVERRRR